MHHRPGPPPARRCPFGCSQQPTHAVGEGRVVQIAALQGGWVDSKLRRQGAVARRLAAAVHCKQRGHDHPPGCCRLQRVAVLAAKLQRGKAARAVQLAGRVLGRRAPALVHEQAANQQVAARGACRDGLQAMASQRRRAGPARGAASSASPMYCRRRLLASAALAPAPAQPLPVCVSTQRASRLPPLPPACCWQYWDWVAASASRPALHLQGGRQQ